jgi:Fe-S cluster biogenesis protein NfuA
VLVVRPSLAASDAGHGGHPAHGGPPALDNLKGLSPAYPRLRRGFLHPLSLYKGENGGYYFQIRQILISEETVIKQEVEQALAKIRPFLQRDGGDIQLIDVTDDGIVKVQLTGACQGCPMSQMTLKQGVEKALMKEVPGVKEVQSI